MSVLDKENNHGCKSGSHLKLHHLKISCGEIRLLTQPGPHSKLNEARSLRGWREGDKKVLCFEHHGYQTKYFAFMGT